MLQSKLKLKKRPEVDWELAIIFGLVTILLFFNLGGRALWWDEIINVLIDRQSIREIMISLGAISGKATYIDVHPPLFHLIQHIWIGFVGSSDFAVRFPNALFALIALYILTRIALILDGPTMSKLALLIVGASPFWLLYARMGRYYALTTMLGLASTWLFLVLLQNPTKFRWFTYILTNVALLYTDYLVMTLLLSQMVYLVWARPGWSWIISWGTAMIIVGLAYIPWLPAWYHQATVMNSLSEADLAFSPIGILFKFTFPLLSFAVGETIFPWEFPALVGYFLFAVLSVSGLYYFWRNQPDQDEKLPRVPFVLLFSILPALGTILVITFVTPTIPFIGIANRTFFAFPFVGLLLAAGVCNLKHPSQRVIAVVILLLIYGYGLGNYFLGRNFFNPIYAVPTETVVNDILERIQPGDVIFSELDTGIGYYLDQISHDGINHYWVHDSTGLTELQQIAQSLQDSSSSYYQRIFVVKFGRDRTRGEWPKPFTKVIEPQSHLVWQKGYTPQNETYRYVKQILLGREDYRFKLLVELYSLPQ